MSRAKGTYSTLENWALDLAPSLPGAAGWLLVALCRQSNYNRKTLRVPELMIAAHASERSVQNAMAYLTAEGYAQLTPEGYILSRSGAEIYAAPAKKFTQLLRKNLHPEKSESIVPVQEKPKVNPEIECHKKKEEEGREGRKEIKIKDSPLPPEGEARDSTAPIQAEGFEIVEVPAQQAADAATAPEPDASLEIVSAPLQPAPKKAPSKPKVPRGAAPALPELPADLAALPGMPEAWAQWFEYRRQRRLTTPPLTATGMANRLQRFAADGDDPVEVIRNAIECGHQGLFRPEKPRNLKFPTRPQTTEAADARALTTVQAVYAALQEDEKLAF